MARLAEPPPLANRPSSRSTGLLYSSVVGHGMLPCARYLYPHPPHQVRIYTPGNTPGNCTWYLVPGMIQHGTKTSAGRQLGSGLLD